MKANHTLAVALTLAALTAVHAQDMKMPMKPAAGASAATMPLVDGEVRKIDTQKNLIVLRHGDIPNLDMPAMTMGFEVADKKMLDGLKVGDKVKFQAEAIKGKAIVTEIKPGR
ncbi:MULTISPECIES: copper-binding protein [Comamonas]|nr:MULTISPECIES: copper-binding protein [Comamonas]MDH1255688.1 copper-binding protein [Comamonas thiooxydans]MDN5503702.1 copper-binding protein [Comamonas sp.]MDN5540237.1 copper-binding protein [Comamonas sp.]TFF56264.1 metal transporter [Comamonas sp. A23]